MRESSEDVRSSRPAARDRWLFGAAVDVVEGSLDRFRARKPQGIGDLKVSDSFLLPIIPPFTWKIVPRAYRTRLKARVKENRRV